MGGIDEGYRAANAKDQGGRGPQEMQLTLKSEVDGKTAERI